MNPQQRGRERKWKRGSSRVESVLKAVQAKRSKFNESLNEFTRFGVGGVEHFAFLFYRGSHSRVSRCLLLSVNHSRSITRELRKGERTARSPSRVGPSFASFLFLSFFFLTRELLAAGQQPRTKRGKYTRYLYRFQSLACKYIRNTRDRSSRATRYNLILSSREIW